MMDLIKPLPGEPDFAYQAFLVYVREQPPRPTMEALKKRLAEVLPVKSVSARQLYRWRGRFEWDRRVLEYDTDLVEVEFQARRAIRASTAASSEFAELRERMLVVAKVTHSLGLKLTNKASDALDQLSTGESPPSNLSSAVRTGLHVLQAAVEMEAQVLGLEEFMDHFERATELGGTDIVDLDV